MFRRLARAARLAFTMPWTLASHRDVLRDLRTLTSRLADSESAVYSRTLMSVATIAGELYFYNYARNNAANEGPMLIRELIEANEKHTGEAYDFTGIDFCDGDVVVDIGANFGLTSLYLAKKHPNIRVIAMEPVPSTYDLLVENLRINQISNVRPVPKAVTGDGRDVTMIFSPGASLGACVIGRMERQHVEYVRHFAGARVEVVPSITLDAVFDQYGIGRCRLLKIDCEGSEDEVLRASNCLERIDHVRGELHLPKAKSDSLEAYCARFFPGGRAMFSRHVAAL